MKRLRNAPSSATLRAHTPPGRGAETESHPSEPSDAAVVDDGGLTGETPKPSVSTGETPKPPAQPA